MLLKKIVILSLITASLTVIGCTKKPEEANTIAADTQAAATEAQAAAESAAAEAANAAAEAAASVDNDSAASEASKIK